MQVDLNAETARQATGTEENNDLLNSLWLLSDKDKSRTGWLQTLGYIDHDLTKNRQVYEYTRN